MFSYIYMKILEGAPRYYDRGIDLLSFGQAGEVVDTIVSTHIREGMDVLDVGCGTGTFAVSAARKGARVVGIDVSPEMLAVAGEKVAEEGLEGAVELINMDVLEMDERFRERSFDCVVSTLVFSELSRDERAYALRECRRVLRDDGILIVAVETRPQGSGRNAFYELLRAPLAAAAWLFAQGGTKAIPDLEGLLTDAGFSLLEMERSALGSFSLAVAGKGGAPSAYEGAEEEEAGPWRRALEPVIEHLFRWFPLPVEPGLRRAGKPGRDSPVLVTANYSLTVKRLRRKIAGLDCYILVVPTRGINNWCSAADAIFNAHVVHAAVKAGRIGELVEHRRLVLPQLSAPGVSKQEVSELSGWQVRFGPVYAEDIPEFINDDVRKDRDMHLYKFRFAERLDLAISMNFAYYLPLASAFLLLRKKGLARFSLLFWSLSLSDYLLFFVLPTGFGWTKALVNGSLFSAAIAACNRMSRGALGNTRKAVLAAMGLSFVLGMDLAGITGVLKDEPLLILYKLGIARIGPFNIHPMEVPSLDEERCVGCGSCYDVCPRGVYVMDAEAGKSRMANAGACAMCRACVKQCPQAALTIPRAD